MFSVKCKWTGLGGKLFEQREGKIGTMTLTVGSRHIRNCDPPNRARQIYIIQSIFNKLVE